MASATLFYQPIRQAQEFINILVSVDDQMVSLKKVMDEDTNFTKMLESATEAAFEFGRTIDGALESYNTFAKMGMNEQETISMGNASMLLATVGDMSDKDSSELLSAAVLQFNKDFEESIKVVDAWNEVSNNFAVTSNDLATAISRAGQSADVAKTSFDELNGMVTAIQASTRRGGSQIGNSLKTIFARLRMDEAQGALENIGIAVMDTSGDIRSATSIFDDLSKRWENLNSVQKGFVSEQIAGKFHINNFMALMNSWDMAMDASATSADSLGSATRELATYQDGLSFKIANLRAEYQKMALQFGDKFLTDSFVGSMTALTSLIGGVSSLTSSLGGLPTILAIIAPLVVLLNKKFTDWIVATRALTASQRIQGIQQNISNIQTKIATKEITALTVVKRGLTLATSMGTRAVAGFSIAMRGLLVSTGVGAGLVAIGFVIEKLVSVFAKAAEKQKELKKQNEDIRKSYIEHGEEINQLVQKYELLNEKAKLDASIENSEEYIKTANRLNEIFPVITSHVDEQGNAHLRNIEHIKQEISYAEKLKENYAKTNVTTFEDSLKEQQKKFDEYVKDIKSANERLNGNTLTNSHAGYVPITEEKRLQLQREVVENERELQLLLQNSSDYIKDKSNAFLELSGASSNLSKENKKLIDDFIQQKLAVADVTKEGFNFEEFLRNLVNEATDFGEKLSKIPNPLKEMFSQDNVKGLTKEQLSVLDSINSSVKDGYTEWDNYRKVLEQVGFKNTDEIIKSLTDSLVENKSATEDLLMIYESLTQQVEDATRDIDILATAEQELREEGKLSQETMNKLIVKYQDFGKVLGLSKEEMLKFITAKKSERTEFINTEIEKTNALIEETKKRLEAMKTEHQTYMDMGKKYTEMYEKGEITDDAYARVMMRIGNLSGSSYTGIEDAINELDKLNGRLIYLGETQNNLQNYVAEGTKKSSKEFSNATYVSDKFKLALESVNAQLDKVQSKKETLAKHSKEYQKAIQDEISLLQQQKKLYDDQYASLNKQIKQGKIQPTGIVTDKSSDTQNTSSYATGGSNADTIWNFFKSKGFSDNIVAGIMGNLKLESGLNPNATNKSSGAFGIAQWLGGRKTGLQNYASSIGTSMNDLATQLNFLWKELNGSEKKTLNWINSNPNASASQMTAMFDKLFERSEGTHIPQRQKYANEYLNQYTGSVPVGGSVADTSKAIAENAQAIDQAKSELLQLSVSSMQKQREIEQRQLELIKLPLYQAEYRFSQIDSHMKIIESNMSKMDSASKEYRQELNSQVNLLNEKKKLTESNMAFIENELNKNKALTQIQRDELQQTYRDLRDSLVDLEDSIYSNRDSFLNSALDGLNKRLDESNQKYTDQIAIIEHLMSISVGNEDEQVKLNAQKLSLLSKQKKEIEDNIRLLESQNQNLQNSKQALEKNKEETKKWREALMGVESSIQGIYVELADKVISAQKDYYRERMEAELEALERQDKASQEHYDNERKRMEDNHKRQIKILDDELKAYQKSINDRLRLIDDLDSERDYNKDLEKLSKEKLDIEAQINKLSLDDSFEANAKRLELQTQLKDKMEQIDELKYKRELELRKKQLQDDLEQKQEEIQNAKDSLQDRQDAEKDQLEKSHKALQDKLNADKESIRKHYDNIINDERKWAKMREDIMKGNLTELSKELVGFSDDVTKNMSHMGDSIKNNLIDKLREAINLMREVSSMNLGGFNTGVKPPSNGGSNSGGNTAPPKNQVESMSGKITIVKPINLWKRDRNSNKLEEVRVLKPGETYKVYGYDNKFGGQYDVGGNHWITDMKDHIKFDKYHDGGIVGGKGNRLTELANKLFNNKPNEQTVTALKNELFAPEKNMPNFFNNIGNLVHSITPNVATPQVTNVNMNIHIDKMNATESEAKSFFNNVNNKLKGMGLRT